MKMIKKISLTAAMAVLFSFIIAVPAWADTVTATIERFTIGGGFIVEPAIVEFTPGESYADVLKRLAAREGLTLGDKTDGTYGYYLEGIKGVNTGLNIPACVKNLLSACKLEIDTADASKPDLYEFYYTTGAGWMYFVNNSYVLGMGQTLPKDGEVVRFQFTLAYGADLTGKIMAANLPEGSGITQDQT